MLATSGSRKGTQNMTGRQSDGAHRKGARPGNASTLSRNSSPEAEKARVTQVLGHCGNYMFPAIPSEFRQFLSAAKQLGQDPSELILQAVLVTMEATVAAAAAQNGRAA